MTPKKLFNTFAKAEAVTWTLLISALVARGLGVDSVVVTAAGGTHGAVFLGYAITAALVGVNQRWALGKTVLAVALAIVPFATIPFEIKLNKDASLDGLWRVTAGTDPRDAHWFDRLFRWFIARPLVLILTLLVALTVVFSFLLALGSPTEWFKN
jgi:integral membrane protein